MSREHYNPHFLDAIQGGDLAAVESVDVDSILQVIYTEYNVIVKTPLNFAGCG